MSYKIRNLVDELDGTPSGGIINCQEKAVLSALASFADEGGYCFPSHKKMVRRSALTRSSMVNALKRLNELKLITSEPREYLDGRQASDDVYVQVHTIATLIDGQREAEGEGWDAEEVEWINGWSSEQVNKRTYPTRPLTPRKTKGGPGGRRGGSGKRTPEGPGDIPPERPADGPLESFIEEPVTRESVTEQTSAAAGADAPLPLITDEDLAVDPLEAEVVEVTHYTREHARGTDLWEAFRGSYGEVDLSEPVDDWTTPEPVPPSTSKPVVYVPAVSTGNVATGFARFWAVYPRPTDQNRAREAWRAARRRGVDAETLIAAAEAYADTVADIDDTRLIKRPAAWLNSQPAGAAAEMAVAA